MNDVNRVDNVLIEIVLAYSKARQKHAPMHSPHEGYAIIKEEFDELWQEVRKWQPFPVQTSNALTEEEIREVEVWASNMANLRKEALHTAAMCLAFLLEVSE